MNTKPSAIHIGALAFLGGVLSAITGVAFGNALELDGTSYMLFVCSVTLGMMILSGKIVGDWAFNEYETNLKEDN